MVQTKERRPLEPFPKIDVLKMANQAPAQACFFSGNQAAAGAAMAE
jgi:hypothetical protein